VKGDIASFIIFIPFQYERVHFSSVAFEMDAFTFPERKKTSELRKRDSWRSDITESRRRNEF